MENVPQKSLNFDSQLKMMKHGHFVKITKKLATAHVCADCAPFRRLIKCCQIYSTLSWNSLNDPEI